MTTTTEAPPHATHRVDQQPLNISKGRAATLRDAIVGHLTAAFPDYPVVPVWVPDQIPEDLLAKGPHILVRVGGREININMGVDFRFVTVEVGVLGLVFRNDTHERDPLAIARRVTELNDSYDALLEQIMGQWSPRSSPLSGRIAEHSFEQFGQPQPVDPDAYHERGLWFGTFFTQYHDKLDEGLTDD